jgi:hypothetical protein
MTPVTHSDPRRVRLVSDGVVAAYIHDISARTTPSSTNRREGTPEARLAHTRAALRRREARTGELAHARR